MLIMNVHDHPKLMLYSINLSCRSNDLCRKDYVLYYNMT